MAFFTYIGLIIIIYYLLYLLLLLAVDCDISLVLAEKFGKRRSKVKGKIIWISQADNDIGEALALEIAENGGKMILSASGSDVLHLIKEKCLLVNSSLKSDDIMVLPMDLAKTETHKSCFNHVLQHFGTVDILICNGGTAETAVWEDISILSDRKLFESNVFGTVSLSRIAVHHFSSKGKGQFAILTSLGGIIGLPYSSTRAAGAHALHGYFESLRNEKLGKSLQVTLLCHGPLSAKTEHFHFDKNEKFNSKDKIAYGMSARRYARLSMVAIINKLDEAWMAPKPIIPLVYVITHFPNLARIITDIITLGYFKWLVKSEI